MKKIFYKRDLPDGSFQIFEAPPEKPVSEYYDDFLNNRDPGENENPLELFFFGKERSYPQRSIVNRKSDCYLLHYITDGEGYYNGQKLSRGTGFIIFPESLHSMKAEPSDPWHFYWIAFGGRNALKNVAELGLDENNPTFSFSFFDKLDTIFDDLLYLPHNDCDIDTYLTGIFYIIMSYHKKQVILDRQKSDAKFDYVRKAAAYIDDCFTGSLKIDEVADSLHITRKYLCTLFKKYTGETPKEYMLSQRLASAAELLKKTNLPIPEIAEKVGYTDYTQLTRLFKVKMSCSPSQYRQKFRESQ